jgi:hypothetical protein
MFVHCERLHQYAMRPVREHLCERLKWQRISIAETIRLQGFKGISGVYREWRIAVFTDVVITGVKLGGVEHDTIDYNLCLSQIDPKSLN